MTYGYTVNQLESTPIFGYNTARTITYNFNDFVFVFEFPECIPTV